MKYLVLTAALASMSGAATAATLDFSTVGDCGGGAGVTFTMMGSTVCDTSFGSPDDPSDFSLGFLWDNTVDSGAMIRATFSALASFVSVDLGDWNADKDTIFLSIYDSADTLIDTVSLFRPTSSYEMNTLSLSGVGIAYAVFGTNADDLGFIVADDFTFSSTAIAAVPLPASGLLLGGALIAAAAGRRRRG
jgi:hypothetical protein